jgi:heme oxygenase (staphylobilin-producing)
MFVVMNRLRSRRDHAAHLERAFRHAGNLQGVPGFIGFQFLREVRNAEQDGAVEYVAMTQWQDRAAYEAWIKSEAFTRAHQGTENSPISASLDIYEVLD